MFSRSLHRRRRLALSKESRALVFPPPNNAAPGQGTAAAGYDRTGSRRRIRPFFVDHHPVVCSAGLVCTRSVGVERRISTLSALSPQNRQPCGVSGIKPARCDHAEPARSRALAILSVHIKQFGDGWCFGSRDLRGPDSGQTCGERVSNSSQPLGAHARRMFQPAVVGGGFQIL